MRHAAGEPADAFEPLRLHQLRFEVLAIADVATYSDAIIAALLSNRRCLQLDPAPGAIGVAVADARGRADRLINLEIC